MGDKTLDFGKVIAYLLPGFVGLWALSGHSQTVKEWFNVAQSEGLALDSVSFVLLGSLTVGVILSGFRWLLFDVILVPILGKFPRLQILPMLRNFPEPLNNLERIGESEESLNAFKLIVEAHWTYYQFYSGMVVALLLGFPLWASGNAGWREVELSFYLGVTTAVVVLTLSALDALRNYRERSRHILSIGDRKMTNGIGGSKMAIAREVSKKTGLGEQTSKKVVDATFKSVKAVLGRGEDVRVPGFGIFTVSKRPARTGRNPATGKSIQIPAGKSVRFKSGKDLKNVVNR